MAKICSVVALLLLVGCGQSPDADTETFLRNLDSLAAQNDIYSQSIIGKQDEALTALAAITSQVESTEQSTKQIHQALEALVVKSEAPKAEEEVIKSALEPQETAQANQSQSHQPVALSPAVRLQFFTQENCAPCVKQSPNAQAAADELGIRLETFHWEKHPESFERSGVDGTPRTLIVIDDKIRVRFVGVVSSSVIVARVNEEIGKARTSAPVAGAIFPLQAANTITSSRPALRSVSRWLGFNRGQRITTRQSCSSGRCP